MSDKTLFDRRSRVFGLADWLAWLDRMAAALFGMSGADFEASYTAGQFSQSGSARDLASVLPLIKRLRQRAAESGQSTESRPY